MQRQTVGAQQSYFCALHGLARAKVLHKDRARAVASLFNCKAHICNQQHARGRGNGLVALVAGKLYAHEAVHGLLAAAQQGGQIKHGKGRRSGLFLAHLYAALHHIAHNVHVCGRRFKARFLCRKGKERIAYALCPPGHRGEARGVNIQFFLAAQGQHVTGLQKVHLCAQRGHSHDKAANLCSFRPCGRRQPLVHGCQQAAPGLGGNAQQDAVCWFVGGLHKLWLEARAVFDVFGADGGHLCPVGVFTSLGGELAGQLDEFKFAQQF